MTRDRIIAPISSDDGPSAPVRHESEYYRTRLALVKIITNPLTVFHSGRFFGSFMEKLAPQIIKIKRLTPVGLNVHQRVMEN